MEDPFSTHTEQKEPNGGGIPTWVWGVGGLVLGGGCCLFLIIGALVMAQPQIEAFFEDVSIVLDEDEAAEAEPEGQSPTAASGSEQAGGLFDTVETVLQRDSEASAPTAARPSTEPYTAEFAQSGRWAVGQITDTTDPEIVEAEVAVEDGVLRFTAFDGGGLYWTTGGEYFASGRFSVEATAVEGPIDNGFGMLLMVDRTADDFYMFEISSDGFVWIGYYENGGELTEPLTGEGWFASEAVRQGLNETNRLSVTADEGDLTFLVNDVEVAQVRDFKLLEGDIGLFVETLGEGNVTIAFDNFGYRPFDQ